jgi:hypothetical protein
VKNRADILNSVKLDDIILTTDGIVREVNVHFTVIQTPGYIHISKSKVGEIENIKFFLNPISIYTNGQITQQNRFFYSEGGTNDVPVTLKSCIFTMTSGSLGSLSYTILEVGGGSTIIMGCTFSSLKMNPAVVSDTSIVIVRNASITLESTAFTDIQIDTNALISGSGKSECEWGLYSALILNESITLIKDMIMTNTYAGIAIHGGTAIVERTDFVKVGSQGNAKYPSVERHLKCGM